MIPFLPLFDWILKMLVKKTLDVWFNPLSHFYFIWNQSYLCVYSLYHWFFFYCIKFQCIIDFYNFRTYYFYEFGRDNQHVALMTGISSGKVCYYKHFNDITNPSTYTWLGMQWQEYHWSSTFASWPSANREHSHYSDLKYKQQKIHIFWSQIYINPN